MINPALPVADQVRDALIDVAVKFTSTIESFDTDTLRLFTAVTKAVLDNSTEQSMLNDLGSLLVTSFMAGREHAEQGIACPITPADTSSDLFVPTDWT